MGPVGQVLSRGVTCFSEGFDKRGETFLREEWSTHTGERGIRFPFFTCTDAQLFAFSCLVLSSIDKSTISSKKTVRAVF